MGVALIDNLATFPKADELGLDVIDSDGDYAHLFRRNGPWEVTLIQRRVQDHKSLVITIAFSTKDAAQRAGAILKDALHTVREISDEPLPDQETCEHEVVLMRFSRTRNKERICELCLKNFGEVPG